MVLMTVESDNTLLLFKELDSAQPTIVAWHSILGMNILPPPITRLLSREEEPALAFGVFGHGLEPVLCLAFTLLLRVLLASLPHES